MAVVKIKWNNRYEKALKKLKALYKWEMIINFISRSFYLTAMLPSCPKAYFNLDIK